MANELFVDFQQLEVKWRKKWEDSRIFESNPDERQKFYLLFAYPTVSGNLHVGHFISYTLPDVIARHKRLMGFNVKFPLGFHATGVDCLKILNESQENLEKACKKYSLEPEAAKQFKTPRDVDKYLEKEIIKSFQMAGLSLDYRTITSTIDPHYNRFIQWQFKKLKEKGCLTQGDYLLPYCPSCKHNVSIDDAEMDISEGAGASVMEYTIIKFRLEDNTFLVAATLRPETIYGLSNMWVRQDVEYVVSEVNEEKWIISKECARKLEDQGKKAKIIGTIKGEELVGKYVESLGTIGKIVILPSKFVDPDVGTGIVMSVPSDAPFDYIALEDIKKDIGLLKKYSIEQDVANVKPISIIKSKGFGDFPAKEIIEKLGIKNQEDPKLEEATQEVYNIGFHTGVMAENCKPYGGMNVLDAKDKVRADLIKNNQADLFSDLSNRVVCRCKTQIILKLLKDQWFLNYSNPEWKKQAKECISQMQTWPPEYKDELPGIIDWLKARPCVRNRGLGTRFPFDESWIIEPLADSTIYMAFYFVSQEFNQKNLTLDDLTDEFFDYVFLGKGKAPSEIAEKIRHNFLYYYPLDINAGGKEHKKVHFPFFIFNHTAVFEKEHWPKGIFLNWHVIVEGEKMSKSKGNSVFWQDAIKKYRADACRLYAVVGSEMWSDFDWRETEAKAFSNHVSNFYNTCEIVFKSNSIANSCLQNVALPSNSIANSCLQNVALPSNSKTNPDAWLNMRFNAHFAEFMKYMEDFSLKKAFSTLFFGCLNDFNWYKKRNSGAIGDVKDAFEKLIVFLSPVCPFVCEELYEQTDKNSLISAAQCPKIDEITEEDKKIDVEEKIVIDLHETLRELIPLVEKGSKKKAKKVYLYLAPEWKYELFKDVAGGKQISEIMRAEKYADYKAEIGKLAKKLRQVPDKMLNIDDEFKVLEDAKEFFAREFGLEFIVDIYVKYDPENNARFALPGKPAIFVEV